MVKEEKKMNSERLKVTVNLDNPDQPDDELSLDIEYDGNKVWMNPWGYGSKGCVKGQGWPISIEYRNGKLSLIVYDDINEEEPKIIDMESARESKRIEEKV